MKQTGACENKNLREMPCKKWRACHPVTMKTLQVELPDQMAREVEQAVEAGVFQNATEVVRVALREFISRRRFELMERQQLDDIAWALREKSAGK
jgi:Arc/MetJ-type ribon-helix-helix transcriptional regulator